MSERKKGKMPDSVRRPTAERTKPRRSISQQKQERYFRRIRTQRGNNS